MELRQLRYVAEIVRAGNHLSAAADALHTSQSAVSRSIQQLERELGFAVFERTRNRIIGLSEAGEIVLATAKRVLADVDSLGSLQMDMAAVDSGRLSIGTTHTLATYVLPTIIGQFVRDFPNVQIVMRQGDPESICDLLREKEVDLAIGTDVRKVPASIVSFGVRSLDRSLVAPTGHPILNCSELTLEAIAKYPLIAYDSRFSGRWKVEDAFQRAGLDPEILMSVIDADVCKTYVRLGLGLGVMTSITVDAKRDKGLEARDASHLFDSSTAYVRVRRNAFLRSYTLEFIHRFAPQLSVDHVRKTTATS